MFDYADGQLLRKHDVITRCGAPRYLKGSAIGGDGKSHGYIRAHVDGHLYALHRLIWMWHHGTDPGHYVDHINGEPLDNRIENLQSVTCRQNVCKGRKHTERNHDLPLGVYGNDWGNFRAMASHDGAQKYLGTFPTAQEASDAYVSFILRAQS